MAQIITRHRTYLGDTTIIPCVRARYSYRLLQYLHLPKLPH